MPASPTTIQSRLNAGTPRPMPVEDLRRLQAVGCAPTIIDVRNDPCAYGAKHVVGSVHVPESKTTTLVQTLQRQNGAVLVCDDGKLSAMVCRTVGFCGFTNVFYLDGGIRAWQAAAGPIAEVRPNGSVTRIIRPEDREKVFGKVYRAVNPKTLFVGLAASAALLAAILFMVI